VPNNRPSSRSSNVPSKLPRKLRREGHLVALASLAGQINRPQAPKYSRRLTVAGQPSPAQWARRRLNHRPPP
jgi:hypothetical protein